MYFDGLTADFHDLFIIDNAVFVQNAANLVALEAAVITSYFYSSFTRFDELLLGVALAMFKNFHTQSYEKVLRNGNVLLVIGKRKWNHAF